MQAITKGWPSGTPCIHILNLELGIKVMSGGSSHYGVLLLHRRRRILQLFGVTEKKGSNQQRKCVVAAHLYIFAIGLFGARKQNVNKYTNAYEINTSSRRYTSS